MEIPFEKLHRLLKFRLAACRARGIFRIFDENINFCFSLHPSQPILAVCTGERIFPHPKVICDDDADPIEEWQRSYLNIEDEKDLENTVQLWDFNK